MAASTLAKSPAPEFPQRYDGNLIDNLTKTVEKVEQPKPPQPESNPEFARDAEHELQGRRLTGCETNVWVPELRITTICPRALFARCADCTNGLCLEHALECDLCHDFICKECGPDHRRKHEKKLNFITA